MWPRILRIRNTEILVTYLKCVQANITFPNELHADVGPNKNVVSHLHTRQNKSTRRFFVIIIQPIDAGRNSQLKQKLFY